MQFDWNHFIATFRTLNPTFRKNFRFANKFSNSLKMRTAFKKAIIFRINSGKGKKKEKINEAITNNKN